MKKEDGINKLFHGSTQFGKLMSDFQYLVLQQTIYRTQNESGFLLFFSCFSCYIIEMQPITSPQASEHNVDSRDRKRQKRNRACKKERKQ